MPCDVTYNEIFYCLQRKYRGLAPTVLFLFCLLALLNLRIFRSINSAYFP